MCSLRSGCVGGMCRVRLLSSSRSAGRRVGAFAAAWVVAIGPQVARGARSQTPRGRPKTARQVEEGGIRVSDSMV